LLITVIPSSNVTIPETHSAGTVDGVSDVAVVRSDLAYAALVGDLVRSRRALAVATRERTSLAQTRRIDVGADEVGDLLAPVGPIDHARRERRA